GTGTQQAIISSDSHVIEDPDLWVKRLPQAFRDRAPEFPPLTAGGHFQGVGGGNDPHKRIDEMAVDGVSAEVLYASFQLTLYQLKDAALQEACFRVYNDWLAEYCSVAPDRLIGVAGISLYDVNQGVEELKRSRKMGLRGALIWLVPHPDLPFTSDHYERFWAAAQDLEMPVSLHTSSGFGHDNVDVRGMVGAQDQPAWLRSRRPIYVTADIERTFFDIVVSGVLRRYPRLKLILTETNFGWIPYFLQSVDATVQRWRKSADKDLLPIDELPSDYFRRQMYATFMVDRAGSQALSWWGEDNIMWSSDFPHHSTTWPNSRQVIAAQLGHLKPETHAKIVHDNVNALYGLGL
ncbi:MAG: amidohydrolase family protein, partial [Chloroflexota bacterium]